MGLPDNTVYSILEDNKNHLWLGTLMAFHDLILLQKLLPIMIIKMACKATFLLLVTGRYGGACFKGNDGTLYFGGNNGFNFFDPLQLKANSSYCTCSYYPI